MDGAPMRLASARPGALFEVAQVLRVFSRTDVADLVLADFAIGVDKHRGRDSLEAEFLDNRLVGGVLLRQICAQANESGGLAQYNRVGKGRPLHFTARDAPIGAEIDHDRLMCRSSGLKQWGIESLEGELRSRAGALSQ